MFDDFSKRSKAVRAALDLAEKKGWRDTTLSDIAQASGLSLSDLRAEFACKSDILRAFQAKVDEEVLAKAKAAGGEQSPRDRLFDLIMTRFDVLAPYKGALRRISAYLSCRPGEAASLACSTLASQYWMLAGARATAASRRSTPRCSRCGSMTTRRRSTRPWQRSTSGSPRASACSPKPKRAARISVASPAGSCHAAGSAATAPRRRPSLHRRRVRPPQRSATGDVFYSG